MKGQLIAMYYLAKLKPKRYKIKRFKRHGFNLICLWDEKPGWFYEHQLICRLDLGDL